MVAVEVDEPVNLIFGGERSVAAIFVLCDSHGQVVGNANVEDPRLAGEDVDVVQAFGVAHGNIMGCASGLHRDGCHETMCLGVSRGEQQVLRLRARPIREERGSKEKQASTPLRMTMQTDALTDSFGIT